MVCWNGKVFCGPEGQSFSFSSCCDTDHCWTHSHVWEPSFHDFVCGINVLSRPSFTQVARGGSDLTTLRAATLRQKRQIRPTSSHNHYILTLDRSSSTHPITPGVRQRYPLDCQSLSCLVWLSLESNPGPHIPEAETVITRPSRQCPR